MKALIPVFILLLTALSCSETDETPQAAQPQSPSVQLACHEKTTIQPGSIIQLELYAYDARRISQDAVLLTNYTTSFSGFPQSLPLNFPGSVSSAICGQPGQEVTPVYYFTIRIDANNDGILDGRDYVMDYNKTRSDSYISTDLTNFRGTVFLKRAGAQLKS